VAAKLSGMEGKMLFDIIRRSIIDFHNGKRKQIVKRNMTFRDIEGKASVFIGVRRCGKSTLLFQLIDDLVSKKVDMT